MSVEHIPYGSDAEHDVIKAMETYGGDFVKALAAAYRRADNFNKGKIRGTWSEYWMTYVEMAKK